MRGLLLVLLMTAVFARHGLCLETAVSGPSGIGSGQAATNMELTSRIHTLETNQTGESALIQQLMNKVKTMDSILDQISDQTSGSYVDASGTTVNTVSATIKSVTGALCGYAVSTGNGTYVPSQQAPCKDRMLLVDTGGGNYTPQCPDGYTFTEVAVVPDGFTNVRTSTCVKN